MNVKLPDRLFQRIVAYAGIVMGVLTTVVASVHLPTAGSSALALFGILLHPDTSITASSSTPPPTAPIKTPPGP
jgi:hypothetical protein